MSKIKCLLIVVLVFIVVSRVLGQPDIEEVRNKIEQSQYFNEKYKQLGKIMIPMSLIMTRIGDDGAFIRADTKPLTRDLTDTISKMLYVFEEPDSTLYIQH